MSQKEIGLKPIVISSPFQNGASEENPEAIYGVNHYRTYNHNPSHLVSEKKSSLKKRFNKLLSIVPFYKKVETLIIDKKPDVLHAHATFFCGLVANRLGRKYNIPVVYEVRSLWEEREKKTAMSWLSKLQPKLITAIETYVMKSADLVVTINRNLEDNIKNRDVKNTAIVTNAVNTSIINPEPIKSVETEHISFGYVGSVSPIEGLDIMANVWKMLEAKGYKNTFHVYGAGTFLNELMNLVKSLNLNHFHIHGQVRPSEIKEVFKTIDVIVNPRIKSKISDTVTPLKPLEAMAYKKLVLASDVGGMKELIEHNKTGLLFKSDDENELFKNVINIIENGIPVHIVTQANEYVTTKKSWVNNAKVYNELYKTLINKSQAFFHESNSKK